MRLMEDVRRMSGASDEEVTTFMAKGMLLNVAAALELPDEFLTAAEGTAGGPALSFFASAVIDQSIRRRCK